MTMNYEDDRWGAKPCEEIKALRLYLEEHGLTVYSEHGEAPDGWVNVTCEKPGHFTFEGLLRPIKEEASHLNQ